MKKTNKKRKKIKYYNYIKHKEIRGIIEKRLNILIVLVAIIIFILFVSLFYIQIIRNTYYKEKVEALSINIVEGSTAPRGKIYDRNHRLIVDNKPTKIIYYKKQNRTSSQKEIDLAYKIGSMIEVPYEELQTRNLKEFWLKNNYKLGKDKIIDEEWKQLEERKLTLDELEELKIERITSKELKKYKNKDKEAAYIYYLMNKGYSYSEKIIKKDNITDLEYANVSENIHNLEGFNTRLDWEREYKYNDVLKTVLGSVSTSESGIPYELKNDYLSKGYSLDDRVGTSYLEYQYEDILRGKKNKYEIDKNGEYKLIEPGNRGNDIVLSIDIELQKAVEEILVKEIKKAKKEPNTEYYNRSFVIISDPNTGEILTMAGKQVIKKGNKYEVYDYSPGITTSPVVVGSAIKGASHIVGYNTGALKIGEVRNDQCIKIASTPLKCSWTYLGNINDLGALKYSSNTYQFHTAINVGKGNYIYNGGLSLQEKAFDTYRKTFNEFGLGVKTGIDLPIESLGYKGNNRVSGLLLDFAIGQYDTYTPIQLSQYIGTIANNGYRIEPHLLKQVYAPNTKPLNNLLYENKPTVLNKINTKDIYLKRVQEGLKQVLEPGGTGYYYIDPKYKPAGKTGTSQSFIDTDNDGVVDKETITNTFVAYAPYDKPKVTFTVISPDISHTKDGFGFISYVNGRIAEQVSKKYFEIFK